MFEMICLSSLIILSAFAVARLISQYRTKPYISKNKVLGSTGDWIRKVFSYDTHGRITNSTGNNHLTLASANTEVINMTYDWADNVLTENRSHSNGTALTFNQRRTYDHQGRLSDYFINLGTGEKRIAGYTYNSRDEMIERNLHYDNYSGTNAWLQSIDYAYNEQGWLTTINGATLGATNIPFPTCNTAIVNPGNTTVGQDIDQKDLFYLQLQYDALHSGLSGSIRKDGNISQAIWRVRGRERQAYSYAYDGLQRITSATYSDINDAGTVTTSNRYNTSYTYADLRGNISNTQRNGLYLNGNCYTQALMDNLTYTYPAGTNKMSSISDNAMIGQGGFRSSSGGYTYDNNGNMITNETKNITGITYNHLNLPKIISFSEGKSLEFTYLADGFKLSKVVKQGTAIISRQDYIGQIEYHNSKVQSIHHSEGRIGFCNSDQTLSLTTPINAAAKSFTASAVAASTLITGGSQVNIAAGNEILFQPGFKIDQGSTMTAAITSTPCLAPVTYEYVIKDHLGNGRVYFADYDGNGTIEVNSGEVLQENHYDPFGYELSGNWLNNSQPDNNYQYNGKELNGDHGLNMYDYGARWYDPSIGSWAALHPKSDKYLSWNAYNYALDNPIKYIDPDGKDIVLGMINATTRNQLLAQLKKLTTDELGFTSDGTIYIQKRISGNKPQGTQLIRDLINGVRQSDGSVKNAIVTIKEASSNGSVPVDSKGVEGSDEALLNSTNGVGTNTNVGLDLIGTGEDIVNEDGTKGGRDAGLSLAHELYHGWTNMQGKNKRKVNTDKKDADDKKGERTKSLEEVMARNFERQISDENKWMRRAN